jgi:hypothetical protein
MLELRQGDNISVTKQWMEQKEVYEKHQKSRSFHVDQEKEKLDKLNTIRQANINLMNEYSQKIVTLEAGIATKSIAIVAKTKDEYLNQLKAKVKAGGELSKTEKEIFDKSFDYVNAEVDNTGRVIDGFYRRKSELANKDAKEQETLLKHQLELETKRASTVFKSLDFEERMKEEGQKKAKKADQDELKKMKVSELKQIDTGEAVLELYKDKDKAKKAENDAIEKTAATEKAAQDAGWNSTLQLGAMMAQKSKEGFIANQALQIANATMSTYAAATKALEAGPIAGPIFSAITIATGLANVGMIASQTYEPVNDFISIPGKPLLKANKDDIVIGGTDLLGDKGGGNNNGVVDAIREQTQVLKRKQMAVSVDPLTGETVYSQNLKGQKTVDRRRV